MPRDPHDDSNVTPERPSENGQQSSGADPDQEDDPTASDNGKEDGE